MITFKDKFNMNNEYAKVEIALEHVHCLKINNSAIFDRQNGSSFRVFLRNAKGQKNSKW